MLLRGYSEQLRAAQAEARRKHEARAAERAAKRRGDHRVQCDTPIDDQVVALLRSLPPAQRDRVWTMDELVARLRGRFKARPGAGDVGVALSRLGWTRGRDWTKAGGGRRVWWPPLHT